MVGKQRDAVRHEFHLNLNLMSVNQGFFLGEARSMFLPVDVFHHLFAVLAGRPTVAASTSEMFMWLRASTNRPF